MRILGSDYDGTLNRGGIDDERREALRAWRAAGNVFALVSGRGRENVLTLPTRDGFSCDFLLAANGAVAMNVDGEVLRAESCDGELAAPLLTLMLALGAPWARVQEARSLSVYADPECVEEGGVALSALPPIERFDQISARFDNDDAAATAVAAIRARFGDRLNPLQNGQFVDVVRGDVNKAEGLRFLAQHLGVHREAVIAVGDNINDADMLRAFKSYAMEDSVAARQGLALHTVASVTRLIEQELDTNYTVDCYGTTGK